jgi:regulator of nucleoside diphosphate kinase
MMETKQIVITRQDLERLRALISDARLSHSESDKHLSALERELNNAMVLDPKNVPPDVVTMNSTIKVKVEGSRRQDELTIVFPSEANIDENRISVLAPLGTALLGYRVGETLEWEVPAGLRRYKITKILHQPEAAGEWDR